MWLQSLHNQMTILHCCSLGRHNFNDATIYQNILGMSLLKPSSEPIIPSKTHTNLFCCASLKIKMVPSRSNYFVHSNLVSNNPTSKNQIHHERVRLLQPWRKLWRKLIFDDNYKMKFHKILYCKQCSEWLHHRSICIFMPFVNINVADPLWPQ